MPPRPLDPHQVEALELSVDRVAYALFMEQRTRKTRVILETCLKHYRAGRISGCLAIGWPNGVQHGWLESWEYDWPEDVPYRALAWRAGMGTPKKPRQELADLLSAPADEFVLLAMNCEAITTPLGELAINQLLAQRRCLVALDEASWAKTPGSVRTKRVLALGRHRNAVLRRILDGTPSAEGSLDLWAPCAFLDPNLLGHRSFYTFKHRYAVWTTGYGQGQRQFEAQETDENGNKVYQNLDELEANLKTFSFRVLRSEVSEEPDPEYRSIYFDLTDKQRDVYDRFEREYEIELGSGQVTVPLAIVRNLRLQMISRNYYPPETIGVPCEVCTGTGCEACENTGVKLARTELERIDAVNPALDALVADATRIRGPLVVWVRFKQDALDVQEALVAAGRRTARYDGSVSPRDRELAYNAFRAGELDAIVGTTSSGLTRGRDLSRADDVIFYSNSYELRDRLQAMDRVASLARRVPARIADLIGVDTRDGPIVNALRAKLEVSDIILGDGARKRKNNFTYARA